MLFPIYFFYSFRDYTYQAHKRLVYEKVPKIKGIEFGIDSKTRSEGRRLGVEGRWAPLIPFLYTHPIIYPFYHSHTQFSILGSAPIFLLLFYSTVWPTLSDTFEDCSDLVRILFILLVYMGQNWFQTRLTFTLIFSISGNLRFNGLVLEVFLNSAVKIRFWGWSFLKEQKLNLSLGLLLLLLLLVLLPTIILPRNPKVLFTLAAHYLLHKWRASDIDLCMAMFKSRVRTSF